MGAAVSDAALLRFVDFYTIAMNTGALILAALAMAFLTVTAVLVFFVPRSRGVFVFAMQVTVGIMVYATMIVVVRAVNGWRPDLMTVQFCRGAVFFKETAYGAVLFALVNVVLDRLREDHASSERSARPEAVRSESRCGGLNMAKVTSFVCWIVGALMAIPAASLATVSHRRGLPNECSLSGNYGTVHGALRTCLMLGVPLLMVMAGADIAYPSYPDYVRTVVRKMVMCYSSFLFCSSPILIVRSIRESWTQPTYPSVLDYVEVVAELVWLFQLVLFPIALELLVSRSLVLDIDWVLHRLVGIRCAGRLKDGCLRRVRGLLTACCPRSIVGRLSGSDGIVDKLVPSAVEPDVSETDSQKCDRETGERGVSGRGAYLSTRDDSTESTLVSSV